MWLAVIDAKSLSVAASASVDSAIFSARTRTLQCCAVLFARGGLSAGIPRCADEVVRNGASAALALTC